jgi:putative flippase GtrA
MAGQSQKQTWDNGFFRAIVSSLKEDIRLWLIILPCLLLLGLALVLVRPPWLAAALSFGLGLVMARLINKIETFPKPDEKKLAESLYRNGLLPAVTGVLVISGMGIFVDVWAMQWRWFHGTSSIPPCSFVWIAAILGFLGNLVAPAVVALLTKERAVFATMVGLLVYFPIRLTDLLSGDSVSRMTSLLAKTCQMDTEDFSTGGFGAGLVTSVLIQVLVAIFVAKVVATWLSRRDATFRSTEQTASPQ